MTEGAAMRILFITDPGIVGGATRSLVDLTGALKARGCQCVVSTSERMELNDELEALGIQTIADGHMAAMEPKSPLWWKRPIKAVVRRVQRMFNLPAAVRKIEREVNLNSFDLIHTNSARNDLGCLLARKYKIKHVMHIREFGQEDFECCCYRMNYYRFLNRFTDRFIAISDAVKDSWIRKGIASEKMELIYNGVYSEDILPVRKESYERSPLRLVMAGGICAAKGQDQAVEAVGLLPENIRRQVTLDLIGWCDEKYCVALKERVRQMGLEKQIRFLGAFQSIHSLLKDYHAALMCSRAEGFGRVTAEYLLAGLAVIASDTGANPELIENEKNGLLYHYGSTAELAQRISQLFEDRVLLERLALAGKAKAQENYTIERNAERIFQLYQKITG